MLFVIVPVRFPILIAAGLRRIGKECHLLERRLQYACVVAAWQLRNFHSLAESLVANPTYAGRDSHFLQLQAVVESLRADSTLRGILAHLVYYPLNDGLRQLEAVTEGSLAHLDNLAVCTPYNVCKVVGIGKKILIADGKLVVGRQTEGSHGNHLAEVMLLGARSSKKSLLPLAQVESLHLVLDAVEYLNLVAVLHIEVVVAFENLEVLALVANLRVASLELDAHHQILHLVLER